MRLIYCLITSSVIGLLAACGGGGGSAGTSSGAPVVDTPPPVATSSKPLLAAGLQDANGTATSSISASGLTQLLVTVKDPSGNGLAGQVVQVADDANLLTFPESNAALTDSAGVARLKVGRSSLVAVGAGSLTVNYTYRAGSLTTFPDKSTPPSSDTLVSVVVGYQLSAANINPVLTAGLQDKNGAATSSISDSGATQLLVTVKDPSGNGLSNQLVQVADGANLLTFPDSNSALTDSAGVARVKVGRSSLVAGGAGFLTVNYTYRAGSLTTFPDKSTPPNVDTLVSVFVGYQLSGANSKPVLTAGLQDTNGAPTSSISASGSTQLLVTVKDPSGNGLSNQLVQVADGANLLTFPESNIALTDSAGVARLKAVRSSLVAVGAGTLTVSYNYLAGSFTTFPDKSTPPSSDTLLSAFVNYQLSANNITLTNLDIGSSTLPAYGTRQVSVQVNVNGVPATTTPVQVSFSAACGVVSPSSAATNANGVVLVTYSATDAPGTGLSTLGCSGKTVEISASTVGAAIVTKSLNVVSAPATNMSFVSVAPSRIFLANSGGPTQSVVTFQVVNARGEGLLGQDINLSLKTLGGGVLTASFGSVGSIASVVATTDSQGRVSVPVFSGSVPTNVLVNAALVSNPSIQIDSSILAIASGRPVQSRVSLSVEKFSIEGANRDGILSGVTISLADRQGNPVPDGTAVNFVTQGGVMIPPVCTTGASAGDSQCSVQIRSQNPRSNDGRITILAYVAGEEDFVDANFNNIFDCGEAFSDLGTAFRDDNKNAAFDAGEFSVPRNASASACGAGIAPTPQVGDGVWGAADVRAQQVIVFATSQAQIVSPQFAIGTFPAYGVTPIATALAFTVQDLNGNSMPVGSSITARAVDNTPTLPTTGGTNAESCQVSTLSSTLVPNTTAALPVVLALKTCVQGDLIEITVTSPLGTRTVATFSVP